MVRLLTFSGPFVSTSRIVWRFILEGIELCMSSFSAKLSGFCFFGVVSFLSEGFSVFSSLLKTDCLGVKLGLLLCSLGFDNLSNTDFWDVGVLSLLKTEVRL